MAATGLSRRRHDKPGWTEWVAAGGELGGGDWLWVEERISELLDLDEADTLFVQGCVRNHGNFYPRFGAVVS